MPPPQPETPNLEEDSLPLDHSHILLTSFNSFLTVAIHNILYYRNIYPAETFLSAKAYNLPVHQNRHPKVCAWIRDAVDAVAVQLSAGHVSRIAIVIHSPLEPSPGSGHPNPPPPSDSDQPSTFTPTPSQTTHQPPPPPGSVLERWLIDTSHFPTWPTTPSTNPTTANATATSKAMRDFSRVLARDARSEDARERHLTPDPLNRSFSWPDLDEQLRGALRRMASAAEGMGALPVAGCTFTVAVELRGEEGSGAEGGSGGGGQGEGKAAAGRAPIGHPQAWIPCEPNQQPQGERGNVPGEDIGGVRTRPIRTVEAGPLFFECWVEESRAKEVLMRMAEAGDRPNQGSTQPF